MEPTREALSEYFYQLSREVVDSDLPRWDGFVTTVSVIASVLNEECKHTKRKDGGDDAWGWKRAVCDMRDALFSPAPSAAPAADGVVDVRTRDQLNSRWVKKWLLGSNRPELLIWVGHATKARRR